mgnify:FL=1
MVNRTKISREIRRRTGGTGQYKPPTAAEVRKKAAQQKTNLNQDEWELVEGTGTGRGNPPKYRMKKGAKALRRSKFEEKKTAPAVQEVYSRATPEATAKAATARAKIAGEKAASKLYGAVRKGSEDVHKRTVSTPKVDIKSLAAPLVRGRKKYDETKTRLTSTDKPSTSPKTTTKKSTAQRGTPSPTTTKTGIGAHILQALDKPREELSKAETQRRVKRYIRSLTRKPGTKTPASYSAGLRSSSKGGKVSRRKGGTVSRWKGGNLEVSQWYD